MDKSSDEKEPVSLEVWAVVIELGAGETPQDFIFALIVRAIST